MGCSVLLCSISTKELPHSEHWMHMQIMYPFWHKPHRHFAKSKSHGKGSKSSTMFSFPCGYLKPQLLFPERLPYCNDAVTWIICALVILTSYPRVGIRIFPLLGGEKKKEQIKNFCQVAKNASLQHFHQAKWSLLVHCLLRKGNNVFYHVITHFVRIARG